MRFLYASLTFAVCICYWHDAWADQQIDETRRMRATTAGQTVRSGNRRVARSQSPSPGSMITTPQAAPARRVRA